MVGGRRSLQRQHKHHDEHMCQSLLLPDTINAEELTVRLCVAQIIITEAKLHVISQLETKHSRYHNIQFS